MRDEFPITIKELLAKRVGFKCSNPSCRQPTSGPQVDPAKVINVGVAAHITAASTDGPRYDPALTPDSRKAADNGIWLCQKCGKLVDNDSIRYPVALIREWKSQAEELAVRELEGGLQQNDQSKPRANSVSDFCNQLSALANILQEDLYRINKQGDNYGGQLKALIGSTDNRIQDLRWDHPGSLLLPTEIRKKFGGVLMTIDRLRSRDGHSDWHACFTLIHLMRETVKLAEHAA